MPSLLLQTLTAVVALAPIAAVAAPRAAAVFPQEVGDPFLRLYTGRDYGAFHQNWGLLQDTRGLIYAGNNLGVLEFDGLRWRLIRPRNGTLVKALEQDASGRILLGTQGDIGHLAGDPQGELQYVSLLAQLAPEDRAFTEVSSICAIGAHAYYLSPERLFRVGPTDIRVWRPNTLFQKAFKVRHSLYVMVQDRGLFQMRDEQLQPLPDAERLAGTRVMALLPWGSEHLLVATEQHGLFRHEGHLFQPFPTEVDGLLRAAQVTSLAQLPDGTLAIGTRSAGLLRLDASGRLIARVLPGVGLPMATIHNMGLDRHQGLWLAMSKGLCRVEWPSALSRFDELRGLKGAIFAVHRHGDTLYAGTDQGIFRLIPEAHGQAHFEPLPGIPGSSWAFHSRPEGLLASGSEHLFEVQGGRPRRVWTAPGYIYGIFPSRRDPDRIYLGLQRGLVILRRIQGRWVPEPVNPEIPAQVRSVVETADGSLWIGTSAQGVFRVAFGSEGPRIQRFGTAEGLPTLKFTNLFALSIGMRVATEKGLYRLKANGTGFEPDPAFANLFPEGPRWLYALREDASGRIWMHTLDQVQGRYESGAAVPGPQGSFHWDSRACQRFAGTWVESLHVDPQGVVWFATREGLVRLDTHLANPAPPPYPTRLRRISVGNGRLLFGGTSTDALPAPEVGHRENRLRFEFAAPGPGPEHLPRFQVFLEGYEGGWSGPLSEPQREYTNLPPGPYRFRVRALQDDGTPGSEAVFSFRILPPWFRTWWAWTLYVLGAASLLRALFRWRLTTLRARNEHLEAAIRHRTRDLRTRTAELEALDQTVRIINREVSMPPLLTALLDQSLGQFPQATRGMILLGDAHGDYTVGALTGSGGGLQAGESLPANGLVARISHEARPLVPGMLHLKPGTADSSDTGSLLCLTLPSGPGTSDLLILEHPDDANAFDGMDMDRLERFRDHATLALSKARVVQRLDITAEMLREVNAQKNHFLGVVAHDLRSPLSGIILAAELLEETESAADSRTLARRIRHEGQEMSALVGRFLDVAAIESGGIQPQAEWVPLAPLVTTVKHRHNARAQVKRIEMQLVQALEAQSVWADPRYLKEVLDNLLSNALKFSPPDTQVTLRIEALGDRIRLSVEDQGPGLTPEDLKAIFGRFSRLSARPTGGEKSTGLGLSIVKSMVEAMEGRVWAEGEPGKGAAFRMELPAAPPDAALWTSP